ncbi:MAG: hypothetical protein QM315_09815 [Bacillota bacterium]|jgi:hypothetical protein|nr:hypothetical protein [Bacillota bacterium]NLV62382.1 hypothetical protein [Clostridiaceae bacterium]
MDTLVVEVMRNRLKKEINEVLKPMELQVGKMEFIFLEKLSLTINLEALKDTESEDISQVV